jgi:splicing factor 3B subunit 1
VEDEELTQEELKERKIMKLLLKVKNGTPPQRKSALRQLTDKARDFGAEALFNQILPLLMSPTLEDQERHLLVKVGVPLETWMRNFCSGRVTSLATSFCTA